MSRALIKNERSYQFAFHEIHVSEVLGSKLRIASIVDILDHGC